MLQKVIDACHRRIMEGDCPTEPSFTREQLEDAVAQLDKQCVMLSERVLDMRLERKKAQDVIDAAEAYFASDTVEKACAERVVFDAALARLEGMR